MILCSVMPFFCFQKIEMTEEVDPVKRTIVRIPRIVKPRGRLRWIGDAIANTVISQDINFHTKLHFQGPQFISNQIILIEFHSDVKNKSEAGD